MLNIARKYYNAGLSVLPIVKGEKKPIVKTWGSQTPLSADSFPDLFNDKTSIAIVCGYTSGGLEVIDIDNHFSNADELIKNFCLIEGVKKIVNKLVIERTPSGGFHIFYKCKKIGRNQKLARRLNLKKRPETLIETRGEGGYIVVYPSINYKIEQGDIEKIPEITPEDRDRLLVAGKALNEYQEQIDKDIRVNDNDDRPGDIFNISLEAPQIALEELLKAGWKQTKNKTQLVRPGKKIKDGISASFGYVAPGILNVFSSNAYPFEMGKGYTPFQILSLLKYDGNFKLCSSELKKRGYFKKSKDNLYKKDREKIYDEVNKKIKKGRYLSPTEKNDLAEEIDVPIDAVNGFVIKCQESLKEIEDYEGWPKIKRVEYFLTKNYKFRINVVNRIAEMSNRGSKWEVLNEHSVYRDLQHNEPKVHYSLQNLKSLLRSDFVEKYNPFVEYFNKLPVWDNIDYIGKICSYIDVENSDFFKKMFQKALVRQIKCALEPNYYNRIVLVLTSEHEEIGKSMFFMWLNPFGEKYYSDEVLRDNKDSRLSLSENFTYNLEELDGLSKYGSAKLKATISTRGVTDRLPYAVNKEYFPRRCTFWGSTNLSEFLTNDKNTRWLPFNVKSINWKGYTKEMKCQDIWTQAWYLYCHDFVCELTKEERDKRNIRNENYRVEDMEESILKKYFQPSSVGFMTNADILTEIQDKSKGIKVKWNTVSLGKVLSRMGFIKKREGNQRGWGIIEKNYDQEQDQEYPF